MSKKLDLKALFGLSDTITPENVSGDMAAEFITALKIYDLPDGFTPEDFAADFIDMAQTRFPGFPTTLWLSGKYTAYDENGSKYEGLLTNIVFEQLVDAEFVYEVLMESLDIALAGKGYEGTETGYAIERDDERTFEDTFAKLQEIYRGRGAGSIPTI